MRGLRRDDLMAVLDFVVDAAEMELTQPYHPTVLGRLLRLIPSASVLYEEVDSVARRTRASISDEGIGADDPEGDLLYWTLGPCPIVDYQARTGDLTAKRMEDVVDGRTYRELPIYRDYYGPAPHRIDHVLSLGLEIMPRRHRSISLYRRAGDGPFSERDVAILDLVRPHLLQLEANAALRRRIEELEATRPDGDADRQAGLTRRELEIVALVRQGKTNAQIAAELWIAPSTVKKHLENVYAKVGIGRRAVAATFAGTATHG
jgi:DNA-binding CsgD family transcriptional regulator